MKISRETPAQTEGREMAENWCRYELAKLEKKQVELTAGVEWMN